MFTTKQMQAPTFQHARYGFLLWLILASLPVCAQDGIQISNQSTYRYSDGSGSPPIGGITLRSQIVDPRGSVMGPDGLPLPSYQGFQIGLYLPDLADPTGTEVKGAVALTATALPAQPGLLVGVSPNTGNANPFSLTDTDEGRFSLLLDPGRGQLDSGRVYILVVTPPTGSVYGQRRIRILLGAHNGSAISYTATSLDGDPISGLNGAMSESHVLLSVATQSGGSALSALSLGITVTPIRAVHIAKTGDQATAEPGDTVVYRITVGNTTSLPLGGIQILDTLPRGFELRDDSIRAAVAAARVTVVASLHGDVTVFNAGALTLAPGQTLTLAYAALLTPEALRGDGKNSAVISANALLTLNGTVTPSPVSDGPAVYTVGVRQGILTDTGTVLGRVWVDRNRDGEQQDGEPGVPGAVILLDDATRIVADSRGLFSMATVTAGYHAAVLDLLSIPGYTLASGRFRESRSQSRLIHITPGGMVRLNFGVVPLDSPSVAQKAGKS